MVLKQTPEPDQMARVRLRRATLLLLFALVLTACTNQQPMPDLSGLPDQPSDFPIKRYRGLAAEGWQVHVPTGDCKVRIHVGRAGTLKARGHSHVISTSDVRGYAARKDNDLIADLYIPVSSLVVDDPQLRGSMTGPGFERELTVEDRRNTRANMLSDQVLDASSHPFLKAGISPLSFEPGSNELVVGIGIRDTRRPVRVPMTIEGDDPMRVSGRFTITHADFGMEPFSALGGAMRVAEEIEIEFELTFAPPPVR